MPDVDQERDYDEEDYSERSMHDDAEYQAYQAEMEQFPGWPVGTVMGCYLCTLDAGGDPFGTVHPQRECLKVSTCSPVDPTALYHLERGHAIT